MQNAEFWIKQLGLTKHPEGGYYRETYRASGKINVHGERNYSTAIYFLLNKSDISKLHRLKSDEIWHFYEGSSLTIFAIDQQGELSKIKLGLNTDRGEVFQVVIKAGTWFGARLNDRAGYVLVGCTVSPGFDFQDFELAKREELVSLFPQHKKIIEELT